MRTTPSAANGTCTSWDESSWCCFSSRPCSTCSAQAPSVRCKPPATAALDVHADDPDFGYRYIADELNDAGVAVSRNTVHSLCKQAEIVAAVHRRRGTGKKAGASNASCSGSSVRGKGNDRLGHMNVRELLWSTPGTTQILDRVGCSATATQLRPRTTAVERSTAMSVESIVVRNFGMRA